MDAKIARRTWLKSIGTGAAVLAAGRIWQDVLAQGPTSPAVIVPAPPTGPFTLPPLPYPANALEPWIDTTTMEIHHGRHHAAYVNNLNKALVNYPDLQKMSVEDLLTGLAGLPETVRGAVQNNAGGHFNHSLFWQWMGPQAGGAPDGRLADLLATAFGSFDKFKEAMTAAALGRFGSGWAWLVQGTDGRLQVVSTANQDSPVTQGLKPLLGVDVWEHAYYLKYQNRRNEYLAAWWNVVDWKKVARGLG